MEHIQKAKKLYYRKYKKQRYINKKSLDKFKIIKFRQWFFYVNLKKII